MSEVGRSSKAASLDASLGAPDDEEVLPVTRLSDVSRESQPTSEDVQPVTKLSDAVRASQPTSQDLIAAAVKVARDAGMTWLEIGSIIGISGQTTSERYGPLLAAPAAEEHPHPEDKAS